MTSSFKINLLFDLKIGPYGGGNQFLKSLKKELEKQGIIFVDNPETADVFIAITYHRLLEAIKLKRLFPQKKLIFRLGDVFRYHRGPLWKFIDLAVNSAASVSDGSIFQSDWSLAEAQKNGFHGHNFTVIHNAIDSRLFKPKSGELPPSNKVKLLSASWSSNPNKGFSYLKFLDNNLDFNKFQMTFIGNSPLKFKNINQFPSLPSSDIATHLKENDIFISASKYEACSNSILEALACGLPVIALNSGSNPEIIKNGGELFNSQSDLLLKINRVASNIIKYHRQIKIKNMKQVANQYLNFIDNSPPKKIGLLALIKISTLLKLFNLTNKLWPS